MSSEEALWIFGYGSLVWRPAFPFRRREAGYIEGWARRFWQASTDHRGVPGQPGRVVTLVPAPGVTTWGVAYEVEPAERESVLARLDHREKGGYSRERVDVRLRGAAPLRDVLVYRATEANPQFLGPAPTEAIVAQIRGASGPSGPNPEYLLELARALRAMDAHDDHVFELERAYLRGIDRSS